MNTPTPHDATFRHFLTQLNIAHDFIELCLPAELRAISDLMMLKLKSDSFVEDDLRQYFSALIYSLITTVGESYVHLLTEHQWSPGRRMAFRFSRHADPLEADHKKLPW